MGKTSISHKTQVGIITHETINPWEKFHLYIFFRWTPSIGSHISVGCCKWPAWMFECLNARMPGCCQLSRDSLGPSPFPSLFSPKDDQHDAPPAVLAVNNRNTKPAALHYTLAWKGISGIWCWGVGELGAGSWGVGIPRYQRVSELPRGKPAAWDVHNLAPYFGPAPTHLNKGLGLEWDRAWLSVNKSLGDLYQTVFILFLQLRWDGERGPFGYYLTN